MPAVFFGYANSTCGGLLEVAITHFTPQIIGRAEGRSAVLAAAYRHCAKMEHDAEARVVDYSRKRNLAHEEFVLPPDAPDWARALTAQKSVAQAVEAFWNRVEAFETRADAQLAKEFIIALPVELSREQSIALFRQFVAEQILSRGQVADWVLHDDRGNPHVHLMTTLRPLTENGFGSKKVVILGDAGQASRTRSGKIQYQLWAGEKADFVEQRQAWLDLQNQHLALAGLDVRVDGRSYADRGISIVPMPHIGAGTKAAANKCDASALGINLGCIERLEAVRRLNARRIQDKPDMVLEMLTAERSVFDEHDIARLIHRYIDDGTSFQSLLTRVLQSPKCLRLDAERIDLATGARVLAKLTTPDMVRTETQMINRASFLSRARSHAVGPEALSKLFSDHPTLSDEQQAAVGTVTGPSRISAVVGRAGAGKTTMMKVAREVWQAAGYRVWGAALAGKAAEGLESEAGIESRTLASWELAWERGQMALDNKTIFVLDEAGMVGSRQMSRFVEAVTASGAKLVLIGDPDQLQPIEAGAAFRAIANRIGYAELGTIYRQREGWMRSASMDMGRGDIVSALAAYDRAGLIQFGAGREDAIRSLISDWHKNFDPKNPPLILAFARRDVKTFNELARTELVLRGLLEDGYAFETGNGERRFAVGDRIVFLKNEISLGVKNGMLASVVEAAPGCIVAEVGDGHAIIRVQIDQRFYRHVDHGYATTIHKSQGATVDDVLVLASPNMDRHLTYVAMSRHRRSARLYVGMDDFLKGGSKLVGHGAAPFENDNKNLESYFVALETSTGQQSTIWGVDLSRALKEAKAQIGDHIFLEHKGSDRVRLPTGKLVDRNRWSVVHLRAQSLEKLGECLSRDGVKETTLEYAEGSAFRQILRFADNRGLHVLHVARTVVRDRMAWTIRQAERLAQVCKNLRVLGERLGLSGNSPSLGYRPDVAAEPMVEGITAYSLPVRDAAEQKLKNERALTKQWGDLLNRIRLVYAQPEAALRAMDFLTMPESSVVRERRIHEVGQKPETFGLLRGKEGIFASKSDRIDRKAAKTNAGALCRDLERYCRLREAKLKKLIAREEKHRQRASIAIPALSKSAAAALENVLETIDGPDPTAGLDKAVIDGSVRAEIAAFTSKVSERFGERAFLSIEAKDPCGPVYERAAHGLSPRGRKNLAQAWPKLCAAQKVAAHERTKNALNAAESPRQGCRQSTVLK